MNRIKTLSLLVSLASLLSTAQERNLKNIQKLTFGGDNAEAYFSPDSKHLTLQVSNPAAGIPCDQIFMLDLQEKEFSPKSLKQISNGKGRTTCSYYMPDGKHILYASTMKEMKPAHHRQNPVTENICGQSTLILTFTLLI